MQIQPQKKDSIVAFYEGLESLQSANVTTEPIINYGEDEVTRFIDHYQFPVIQHAKSAEELGLTITPLKTFVPATIPALVEAIETASTIDNATLLHSLTYELIQKSGLALHYRLNWKTLANEGLNAVKSRYSKAVESLINH